MAAAADTFIIESCENVTPFYLSSNPNRPRRTLFFDDAGSNKGTLHVSKQTFDNLDDSSAGKITGILLHIPANGFQYVVTPECPVMRSSNFTWLFPNAEPEVEGQQANDTGDEKDQNDPNNKDAGNYHCFGITFPTSVDSKVLDTFEKELKAFCDDYREASLQVLPQDAVGTNVSAGSSVQELMVAAAALSKTMYSKTSDTISSELAKRPQLKEKLDKAKEKASKAKDKIVTKFKESKIQEKFAKATRRLSKEAKALADDLKVGNTDNVAAKFDKGTQKTVDFIQLVTRKGADQIQSVKTVLIQRMPEIDPNTSNSPDAAQTGAAGATGATGAAPTSGGSGASGASGASEKKVDDNIKQGLDKAKQGTAFVGQVGQSVVKAVAIGAGHTVKAVSRQVEQNERIQKHVEANPITYGNIKVIGKKTLNAYVTIANELENAAIYLFSESAHAAADVTQAKYGQEVGQAAHDGADVAVNIVNIFRLDNDLIYGTIQEATTDTPQAAAGPNQQPGGVAAQSPQDAAVQAAVGQAVMASLVQTQQTGSQYGK